MARQTGIIRIKGRLGDLSFYESVYGPLVRRAGGPSREQIKKKSSCRAIRDSNAEFTECAGAGKLLRNVLRPLLLHMKDHSLVSRTSGLMLQLKNCDPVSLRGKRKPGNGLLTLKGKELIMNFELNKKAPLKTVLKKKVEVDSVNKTLKISLLNAEKDITWGAGATHVKLKGSLIKINLTGGQAELQSSADFIITRANQSAPVLLQMNNTQLNMGIELYYLSLEFLQEVNGIYFNLENGRYNTMKGLKVV